MTLEQSYFSDTAPQVFSSPLHTKELYKPCTTYYFVELLVQHVVTVCSRFMQVLAMVVVREREISVSAPGSFL